MTPGLWKDENGSAVEYFAVAAALIAAMAWFVGFSAQQLASNGDLPTIAFVSPDEYVAKKSRAPSFNTIDYSATGSVKSTSIILDPCTGRQQPR